NIPSGVTETTPGKVELFWEDEDGSIFQQTGLIEEAAIADGDFIPFFDITASQNRKVKVSDLLPDTGIRGSIDGLILSNNVADAAKDLDIAVGAAQDDGNAVNIVLAAALTKQLDAAWAVGTNAGALDGTESVGGTPDASTWYHIWLNRRSDTGVVDVLASESATAPTMPTNYDQKRLIGAVLFDATPDIIAFTQYVDGRVEWVIRALDYSDLTPGTSAVLVTVSTPLGIKTQALLTAGVRNSAEVYVVYTSPDSTDIVPGATNFDIYVSAAFGMLNLERMTNTSSQIRLRSSDDIISTNFQLACLGFIHPRGRDA
ncbi:hypothetical protein LCGC14_2947400, partial [marine sediment metagenome]